MKILHITNIAQNAYINSLVLGQAGHQCDVLAYDLYHFACSPEWYELFEVEVGSEVTRDNFFPDFYSLNENMPLIGPNVAHGPMFNALVYLDLRNRGHALSGLALSALQYLRFKCTMLKTTVPFTLVWPTEQFEACIGRYSLPPELCKGIREGRQVDDVIQFIRERMARFSSEKLVMTLPIPMLDSRSSPLSAAMELDAELAARVGELRRDGRLYALGLEVPESEPASLRSLASVGPAQDIIPFQLYGDLWRRLNDAYDVLIFYGDSSIFAVPNGIAGYCALEHGTIRAIPFEDSTYARLVAEGYRRASKVFITNSDYVTNKRRLSLRADQMVYLPHPFDEQRAFAFKAKYNVPARRDNTVRFFCPARQDWRSGDPKMAKGNDRIFGAARALLDDGIDNFHLTCIAWGVDLEASQALCAQLGIAEQVEWIQPLTKRQLWEAMLSHDCIIDQFLISAMGGVTFEALALGRRLISRDDGIEATAFFGQSPPILSAETAPEIAARMRRVIADPDDGEGIGERCMQWVARYHSAARITELQMKAFAGLPSNRRAVDRPSLAQWIKRLLSQP